MLNQKAKPAKARKRGWHVCRVCPDVIAAYEAGAGLAAAGAAGGGISAGRVREILVHHGVRVRGVYEATRSRVAPWADEALRLHATGETMRAIGERIGVTRERVRQVLASRGVTGAQPPRHRCGPACAAVLAASGVVVLVDAARQTGITPRRLKLAARHHGVQYGGTNRQGYRYAFDGRSRGPQHVCTEKCERALAMLRAGVPRNVISRTLRLPPTALYGRWPAFHPDWPWFDGRKKNNGHAPGTPR